MNKLLPLIILTLILSCRKDAFITGKNAVISFSTDTVHFDTVFTTAGSVTKSVKIINGNDKKLRLTAIKLMGGSQSYFTINVDGSPGPAVQDIELDGRDSLFIFVTVRIQPNAANLPFLIGDSVQVSFNGNLRYIQLQAWGQNAHFLRNQTITGHITWDNSLPYVILGGLRVDTNATLSISSGCRIYLHADAPLLVNGTLQVSGGKADSLRVYFQGDRLDAPYRNFPGSWPGIYFTRTSYNNVITYGVIRNAYQAIVAGTPATNAGPGLILDRCIIDNSYDAGILGTQSSIQASNCLISNCGRNVALTYGGNYQFTYCTVASYSNDLLSHIQPVLSVSNYTVQGGTQVTAPLQAGFVNCIFWGNYSTVNDEVFVSRQGSAPFSVKFTNCLWRVKTSPGSVDTTHIIANTDPRFDSINPPRGFYDFHLQAGSPAIGKGVNTGLPSDLDGNPRSGSSVDLGCYQHQ